VRFISFYVPDAADALDVSAYLLAHPGLALDLVTADVDVRLDHATLNMRPLQAGALPFSGRVHLYLNTTLDADQVEAFHAYAAERNLLLDIRDASYAGIRTSHEQPRAFLSHDSRDKEALVRPLANTLRALPSVV
jgi:hypothetical protein